MTNPFQSEPALSAAGILSAVSAIFPVLAEFKIPVSPALQSLVVALVTVAFGAWVRSRVSPVAPKPATTEPKA